MKIHKLLLPAVLSALFSVLPVRSDSEIILESLFDFGGGVGRPARVVATSSGWAVSYPRNGKVAIFDAAGTKLREITGLRSPLGVAFAPPDSLYVGEQYPGQVSVWKTDGTPVKTFGSGLGKPVDIKISSSKVFVLDAGGKKVFTYDLSGNQTGSIGDSTIFRNPSSVGIDPTTSSVYVSELMLGTVHVFAPDGTYTGGIGFYGGTPGMFSRAQGFGFSDMGLILVGDTFLSRIQALDKTGQYVGQGGAFGSARGNLSDPVDIAMGPNQRFAVADYGNGKISLYQIGYSSFQDALSAPENVVVNLPESVVSAGSTDFGSTIYIEKPDRTSGVRVEGVAKTISRGALVRVAGKVSTVAGHKKISATDVTVTAISKEPRALGMYGGHLGGIPSSESVPAVDGAYGVYTVGLLVRVSGRVVSVHGADFHLNDGSGYDIWVHTSGTIATLPAIGQFVTVTGICSTAYDSSNKLRSQILPRNANDIRGL